MATGISLDEGDVVVVGAGGSSQDPHEVTVVAEVLEQTGHPPALRQVRTVTIETLNLSYSGEWAGIWNFKS